MSIASEGAARQAKLVARIQALADETMEAAQEWKRRALAAESRVKTLEDTEKGMGAVLRLAHPYKQRAENAEARVKTLEAKVIEWRDVTGAGSPAEFLMKVRQHSAERDLEILKRMCKVTHP